MKVVCSNCKRVRVKKGEKSEPDDGLVSHGMCLDCMEVFYRKDLGEEEWENTVRDHNEFAKKENTEWVEDLPKEQDNEVKTELGKNK